MNEQPLSLLELNKHIKKQLAKNLDPVYWVIAEISELKVNYRGHCYLELVDKPENSDEIVARSRAVIWSQFFRLIQPYFETTTRQSLSEGIKVLVKVTVDFHELYGLSLNIKDIDPTYTLGDLARQKQEILNQLMDEGVMDMNKQLAFPQLPKRIAIISSEQAAGYQDFLNQLQNNGYGYTFHYKLFPAVMQGKETEKTIIQALEAIYSYEEVFDAVVIIRGGGSQSDLNSFNTYWLAYHVTQFPIPVLSGIGHEKDDTIVDLVAHTRLKTPTAVAEFIVDRVYEADQQLQYLTERFYSGIAHILDTKKSALSGLVQNFYYGTARFINQQNYRLMAYEQSLNKWPYNLTKNTGQQLRALRDRMIGASRGKMNLQQFKLEEYENKLAYTQSHFFKSKHREIENYAEKISYLDPKKVLERGYSITYANDELVRNAENIEKGTTLRTILEKGEIKSTVSK